MNTDILHYIENLEEHAHQANAYVEAMKKKRFKSKKDRNALKYWLAYGEGIERAIFLAEIHLGDN